MGAGGFISQSPETCIHMADFPGTMRRGLVDSSSNDSLTRFGVAPRSFLEISLGRFEDVLEATRFNCRRME